jgi:hypothetical protein
MIQLSSPILVTPPPSAVPRLMVTNWDQLRSPMTNSARSPEIFILGLAADRGVAGSVLATDARGA